MATGRHRGKGRAARWALTLIALAAVPVAGAQAQANPGEGPTPTFGFGASISVGGVRQSLVMPSFVALGDTIAEFGVPVAQAVLNSGGVSEAFAANPYPGELGITGGDLAGGASGVPNPLPPYPAYAKASHPDQPEAAVSAPGYNLAAVATPRRARADGSIEASPDASVLRVGSNAAAAEARISDAGKVEVIGISVLKSIDIAGLFEIGELRSEVTGMLDSTGKPTWTTKLEMTGASISGTRIALTPEGLMVVDQTFGNPVAPADPLLELLKAQGISVELVGAAPEDGDDNSMSSQAIRIVIRQGGGATGAPATELHFLVGSVTGRLFAGAEDDFAAVDDGLASNAASGEGSATVGDSTADFGNEGTATTYAADLGQLAAVPAPLPAAPKDARQPGLVLLSRDLQSEIQLPYVLLAFGGFTLVAMATSWRRWIAPIANRYPRSANASLS